MVIATSIYVRYYYICFIDEQTEAQNKLRHRTNWGNLFEVALLLPTESGFKSNSLASGPMILLIIAIINGSCLRTYLVSNIVLSILLFHKILAAMPQKYILFLFPVSRWGDPILHKGTHLIRVTQTASRRAQMKIQAHLTLLLRNLM